MPQSPNQAKSNGNDKNTIIKKKTIIQDTRLNKSTNISDLNPPPLQTNSNSSNNDDWKQQTGKRNHSSSSEPNSPTNIQKTTKNKKIFTSRNRFEVLSQTESIEVDTIAFNPTFETNDPESNPQQEKITHLPPPIMVKGVLDFVSLRAELIDLVGPKNFTFKSSINNLKIQTKNPETYRAIIHFLQEEEADFHTFQMQEHKAYRIVIRNLHPTTNTAEIRTALEEIGYQIKIEEPYKRRDIVQCLNCQEYGHTKTYCSHTPRCVRCAEHHPTSTCQKPRNLPAKCALCQGEHPANYKGCQIHKELQKLRNLNSRSNQPTSTNNQFNPKTTAKAPSAESNPSSSHNRTYANVTSNQEPPKSDSDQPDPSILLSKFISDFQALITPLLSFLTTVLAKLAAQNDK
ncbi:hypothetical protein QTP88_017713 [Uroleucon formosanum]